MTAVEIEFGSDALTVHVPDGSDLLTLPKVAPLVDATEALQRGLDDPIGGDPLATIVQRALAQNVVASAAIVISDNTRPVPYGGPQGILPPLLGALRSEGVQQTVIIVATGTHRGMTDDELRELLPDEAFAPDVRIVNHDCTDRDGLRHIGRTTRGTDAWVNALYLDADIKILTGLVEPHFMAGFSGGRKAICPGLVGMEATHIFHGAAMMAHPQADSLVLEGNPCHEEALEVARMAGCDFVVNVTIDRHKQITGLFCGEMEAAHAAACIKAADTNTIPIAHAYDIVVTHAGFAGINHYQAAKAACEGAKAVRQGGAMILAANHTDVHPVGGVGYRRMLALLHELGPTALNERLRRPDWSFVPEQWEAQKWAEVFTKLGRLDRLDYCAPRLTGAAFQEHSIPGNDGGVGLEPRPEPAWAAAMVQRSLDQRLEEQAGASVALLLDGPYGVPSLNG
ncbi:MAG: nickel-dependent lactate racemase [Lentisphaerae bacterium]|nr:nickel-dependent lactate racemase [Lentisphaerota bacterium]